MIKNEEIVIDIIDVTAEGSGVGRYDNMAVFVPLTAVGDTVKAKILKVKKTYAYAKALEIIEPSSDRINPDCKVFNKCGGCVYRHISYKAELSIKENKCYETIKRIGGIDLRPQPIISAQSTDCYRNKAQYPVNMEGKFGFFAFHSHRIIPCSDCRLQPAIFGDIAVLCENFIKHNNISIYNESDNTGLLRHLYLRIAEKTGEIMLTLVINGDSLPFAEEFISEVTSRFPSVKSIQININKANTNVILGDKCVCLYGEPYISDILCGMKIRISPLSFYQVNRTMAEILYKKAAFYADVKGKNILDLYCGAGTIGLSMSREAKSVIGVEIVPQAIEDAKFNAKINDVKNISFICADAAKAAEVLAKQKIHTDVVVLDPPRKGCSEKLIETICNTFAPERVVYVSCDVATLARDIKLFSALGYTLKEYTPVDLFPRTSHVETVALLSQRRPDEHIDITIDLTEFDTTAAELKATYPEIKEYVLNKFGLKVSSLYISQVKTKCGIIERENYNKGKAGHRVPQCPKEKEDAIMDALKHFKMI